MRKAFLLLILMLAAGVLSAQARVDQQVAQKIESMIQVRNQFRQAEMKRLEALAQMPQPTWNDFDVTTYRLHFNFDFPNRQVFATAQVGLRVLVSNLERVGLDFSTLQITIDSVGLAATSFSQKGDSLYLTLDRTYTAGETLRVAVSYHGRPRARDGFPVFYWRSVNGQPAVFSDNEPYYARCWFPCRDYPGDKADSTDMIVTVPKPLVVASNGSLRSVVDNGDGTLTYHWHESYPITTYLMSLAIADYRTVTFPYVTAAGDTMPVDCFLYPADLAAGREDLSVTPEMIQAYAGLWGEYPFVREKYGQAQYGGMWGGMENQTMTSLNAGLIRGNHASDIVVAHELAHQWWGDCISPREFGHVWLNEGFATFAEALWVEHLYGADGYAAYMRRVMGTALGQMAPIYRYPGSGVIVGVVYDKGASVLHMLRRMVGDSVFFEVIRDYFQRFAYSVATTEDLQQVFEDHTGLDWGWFFQQWIYEPGHPVVSWDWVAQRSDTSSGYIVKGFLEQVQTVGPQVFRIPVTIVARGEGYTVTYVTSMNGRSLDFAFAVPSEPTEVLLDPDQNVLMEQQRAGGPVPERVAWSYEEVSGDGDGRWEPGESIGLTLRYRNAGRSVDSLVIDVEPVGDDLSAATGQVVFDSFEHGDTVVTAPPVVISASADAASRLALIRLHLRMPGGFQAEDSVVVPLGQPSVLFVDDDGGSDYDRFYTGVFQQALVYADSWTTDEQGVPDPDVNRYPVMIWETGAARQNVLTPEEQQKIRQYLASGGRVLIAGQNLAASLATSGNSADTLFLHQVLHARFVADNPPTQMTLGTPGDPIGNRLFIYFEGSFGTKDPISPDVLQPLEPAVGFLGYAGHRDEWAGLRWYDSQSGAALVVLSFGLEAVRGPYEDSATRLLARCVDWLTNPSTTGVRTAGSRTPRQFELKPAYPNPFNPGTTVRFDLPRRTRARLLVYNLLGQPVRTLVDRTLEAGSYSLRWDGRDDAGRELPTGVYLIELRAGGKVMREKAVRIR